MPNHNNISFSESFQFQEAWYLVQIPLHKSVKHISTICTLNISSAKENQMQTRIQEIHMLGLHFNFDILKLYVRNEKP